MTACCPGARAGGRAIRPRSRRRAVDAGAPSWPSATCGTPDVLDRLLLGVDAVCHQAAVVGHGRRPVRRADLRVAQRPRHGAVCWRRCTGPGCGGWCWRRRWWSTARAATRAPCTAWCGRACGGAEDVDARRVRAAVPGVRRRPGATAWCPRTRRWTRGARTRPASSRRSTTRRRGPGRPAARCVALRYHNVYGPRMPRDTPYAGVASLFRSALQRGEAPTVLEDGRQRRDFVHVTDVARGERRWHCGTEPAAGTLTPVNVCSGEPHTVGELATELARGVRRPGADDRRRRTPGRRPARGRRPGASQRACSASRPRSRSPKAWQPSPRTRSGTGHHRLTGAQTGHRKE